MVTQEFTCVSHTQKCMDATQLRIGVRFVATIAHKKCVIYMHIFSNSTTVSIVGRLTNFLSILGKL